jgi:hypothetical protein
LFISFLPWLTVALYIFPLFSTLDMIRRCRRLDHCLISLVKAVFKIIKCKNMGKPLKFFLGALFFPR